MVNKVEFDLNDKLRVTIGTRESNERVSLVTELLEGGANGNGKRGERQGQRSSKRQKK